METTVQATTDYLANNLAPLYMRLIVALIILLVGFMIGKLLGKLVGRIIHEVEIDSILRKASGMNVKIESFISAVVTYFIYLVTIIMVLNQLGMTTTILQMISAAVIIIVAISIILGIKDFVPNAFAGFYIYKRNLIRVGERIRVKGLEGKVMHINLVETKLETKDGDTVYVPNSAMTQAGVMKMKTRAKKKIMKKL